MQAATTSIAGAVCGTSILRSPFSYHGKAGGYRSGRAGLPTYGRRGTNFPHATAGVVLPPGAHSYYSYNLRPNTVYYLAPGVHFGNIQADAGDAFVGGYYHGHVSSLSGEYHRLPFAIDSNSTNGDQKNVVIEFLTITKYQPGANAAAINQDTNTGWVIRNNVISGNVPGAGVMLGSYDRLANNCMTRNGQYGFQSVSNAPWYKDPLTTGTYNMIVSGNEISYNDTCDFEGTLTNAALGWRNFNPVPARYRSPYCGTVTPDGDQGGFKLWETDNVTIENNSIHNNYGPGAWADTNNANTTYTGNRFVANDGEAIMEEISYNFSITRNYMADNGWVGGLGNPGFPQAAIYVSESGSDRTFGGVPGKYHYQSTISGNTLVNNGGSIFLWQNSNRFCSDGSDSVCTLVGRAASGPFTTAGCRANLPKAAINLTGFLGVKTGSPLEDWWDGCQWRTENVQITRNAIDFNPAAIPHCTASVWAECGVGGMFSEYGSPPSGEPGWVIPTDITFYQDNVWSHNTYRGPSTFYAWNQGNGKNPVTWAAWTGSTARGDKCGSSGERSSGYCTGPFGQDTGSTYTR